MDFMIFICGMSHENVVDHDNMHHDFMKYSLKHDKLYSLNYDLNSIEHFYAYICITLDCCVEEQFHQNM